MSIVPPFALQTRAICSLYRVSVPQLPLYSRSSMWYVVTWTVTKLKCGAALLPSILILPRLPTLDYHLIRLHAPSFTLDLSPSYLSAPALEMILPPF